MKYSIAAIVLLAVAIPVQPSATAGVAAETDLDAFMQQVLARRMPPWVNSDHLTLLGFIAMFVAGLSYWAASVDRRDMQYLYKDGDDYVFMDTQSFEQTYVPQATVGDSAKYMLENQMATVAAPTLSPGVHAVTAVYGGDANNAGSTSLPLAQSVLPAGYHSAVGGRDLDDVISFLIRSARISKTGAASGEAD